MTTLEIILAIALFMVSVMLVLNNKGEKIRHGIVWKKTQTEVHIRPDESVELLYVPSEDTENRLQSKLFKEICYVKKGKDITLYYSEKDVLKLLGDAVPVVRCGECKWCVDGCVCVHPDSRNPIGCRKNDYCNEGERR